MNKVELADKIAEKIGLSKNQVEDVLNAFVDITINTLKQGGEVTLTGFGAFSARQRKGREGINPRRPEEKITIPSVTVAKFKAGKNLKEALKSPESDVKTKPTPSVKTVSVPAEENSGQAE
ncbi:MAG: hypothetical protein A3B89_00190 [Candidatus Buchananbacteria bacterium RIFCSPHIGHO2_02_FULL_40_13]|uniref:DNA-binding protein n=1 Tax=Candidatus Buchananbacteria bacterium RIFCSPLOWO2_01_FULL_39_33 TaxID=1797543 RepID=A0A1G1YHI4_9BACT|nr:MAG: hypothetical protein A2820_03070 [Candidatus Buchananbacteria bacterium RIFCSPHIGHO2_01_FULL_40_35]OGY49499.1 MAG: hypothetical protein A3B89_00190 [Candidatus Buchananbacteria bacterium RIFCSPHIGHO2_02_FULL_40_13]OGY51714.1 MAG: hypothetical protein A3A02_02370 [Candidatus Buchananbacteria bacterium RIFCSPLOWO2_01_FULL_39_33]